MGILPKFTSCLIESANDSGEMSILSLLVITTTDTGIRGISSGKVDIL